MKINWIHFSDLHLGNDSAVDTRLMRKKLPEYIAGFNRKFDYAFCSGDIKEWSNDYTGADEYLKKLCDSAQVSLDNLYIVPGNHDVKIDETRAEVIKKLKDYESDYYRSDIGVIEPEDLTVLKSGEAEFIDFIDSFLGSKRAADFQKPHFVIKTEHFNILHLDSTLTYGAESDHDFIIGTRALMDTLEECSSELPTIILTHYSFDFLNMKERDQIETLMNEYNVQLWFAGHEHENLIRKQREKFWECQCGNLMLQKGARSCVLTGEYDIDSGEGIITVHAWYESKGWGLYPFARVGAEDNSVYPFALNLSSDTAAKDVSRELINAREAFEAHTSQGNTFYEVDINPYIFTDLEFGGKIYRECKDQLPLSQVMSYSWMTSSVSCHSLLLGDGGMGKSTMMYYQCGELLSKQKLSVYVSLQARESTDSESIINYILRVLYKSTDQRARDKFNSLTSTRHTTPDLTLFIDGFNELTGKGAQKYVAEIKELSRYPGVQILISSRLDFLCNFGLSHFGMINTCDLREEQIKVLFSGFPKYWRNITRSKNLTLLVKNPMMALLYANTCPVVEKYSGIAYLDWVSPITNASDLLRNYYLAQVALLAERDVVDGAAIFRCLAIIDYVVPALAYCAERNNKTSISEEDFENILEHSVSESNAIIEEKMPHNLSIVKRIFRFRGEQLNTDDVYDALISELCLLKSGNGMVSFNHQIYRDYLAATYLFKSLIENRNVEELWVNREIKKGVTYYLSFLADPKIWDKDGMAAKLLLPYRGVETDADNWFIANIVSCWLSVGKGERDLSFLDLRKVSLTEHLKTKFNGTINIDNAWVNKEVFINDKHHDRIISICFSHDNRTMAAVSANGIVSITNLVTQSQMIVAELGKCSSVVSGFDADDYLIINTGEKTIKWASVDFAAVEEGDVNRILSISTMDDSVIEKLNDLKQRLKESDMTGIYQKQSENGMYLAVGFDSGMIQVWDTVTQDCIANLSLSDSHIITASFTKDGKIAALGSGGKMVQIWDIATGTHIRTIYFDLRVIEVRFADSEYILTYRLSDGTYSKVNIDSCEVMPGEKPSTKGFTSKALLKKIKDYRVIESASNGNAIIINNKGMAFTWDEKIKKISACSGHNDKVTLVAICDADARFAASYSPERYHATKYDKYYKGEINNQRLVRVRIVKTGQCQRRLPTKGRSLTKLKFFTDNRIVLAGYASNGDILLWELINKVVGNKEHGKWDVVNVVIRSQSEPLECAVPEDKQTFIGAFADGTISVRPFNNPDNVRLIKTLPGIDASVFRWETLKCEDEIQEILSGYSIRIFLSLKVYLLI